MRSRKTDYIQYYKRQLRHLGIYESNTTSPLFCHETFPQLMSLSASLVTFYGVDAGIENCFLPLWTLQASIDFANILAVVQSAFLHPTRCCTNDLL